MRSDRTLRWAVSYDQLKICVLSVHVHTERKHNITTTAKKTSAESQKGALRKMEASGSILAFYIKYICGCICQIALIKWVLVSGAILARKLLAQYQIWHVFWSRFMCIMSDEPWSALSTWSVLQPRTSTPWNVCGSDQKTCRIDPIPIHSSTDPDARAINQIWAWLWSVLLSAFRHGWLLLFFAISCLVWVSCASMQRLCSNLIVHAEDTEPLVRYFSHTLPAGLLVQVVFVCRKLDL